MNDGERKKKNLKRLDDVDDDIEIVVHIHMFHDDDEFDRWIHRVRGKICVREKVECDERFGDRSDRSDASVRGSVFRLEQKGEYIFSK